MDFYGQQNRARRYTGWLLFYFFIAIVLIVVALNVIIYYAFIFLEFYPYTPADWFSGGAVYYVTLGSLLLISSGSLYRWYTLRSGGAAVARMVGAEPVNLSTTDIKERQLINVVEEMSIASGVVLPALYVMRNENGINAFVAGYEPDEAVMVVTEGAIRHLNRAELQGVVAHEYSHILNGDMRINIRLMALLNGIVMISVSGRFLLRGGSRSSRGRSAGGLIVLALMLIVLGYIGVFAGRVIRAAVSRQREYLADAAAVQFTRNPQGIASALNAIRLHAPGSIIEDSHAEDMSHMCFSQALQHRLTSWMATHPPLDVRIQRIDPSFSALLKARGLSEKLQAREQAESAAPQHSAAEFAGAFVPLAAAELVAMPGHVNQAHISYAEMLHNSLSDDLLAAAHDAEQVCLLVYALLISKMDDISAYEDMKTHLTDNQMQLLRTLVQSIKKQPDDARLPLLDIMIPTLKQFGENEKREFLNHCRRIIKSDNRYTLHEFVMLSLLELYLYEREGEARPIRYHSYRDVEEDICLLLELMARVSELDQEDKHNKIYAALKGFSIPADKYSESETLSPVWIRKSLSRLAELNPLLKKGILQACADLAILDGKITSMEAELIRMIAESLHCPLPPLLPLHITAARPG